MKCLSARVSLLLPPVLTGEAAAMLTRAHARSRSLDVVGRAVGRKVLQRYGRDMEMGMGIGKEWKIG